ncbi:MAG: bifunctional DNA primase/polymerase [Acidobacteriaceae bacterium]
MKSAEQFLEALLGGAVAHAKPIPTNILPREVEEAASRGLRLAPIRSLSRFPSGREQIGSPTVDLVQLRSFAIESPMCNWAMSTDDVIVLEYNSELGRHALCELCDGDWDGWRDTLQFRSGGSGTKRSLLFRRTEQKLRNLGARSPGLRLHSRDMILVPPSRFLTGPPLAWLDISAAIKEVPWWLVNPDGREDSYLSPQGYGWYAGCDRKPIDPEDWGSGRSAK